MFIEREVKIMDQVEIVIVTGMSGAGKTSAMACFEKSGIPLY